jgi:hypothetical protein
MGCVAAYRGFRNRSSLALGVAWFSGRQSQISICSAPRAMAHAMLYPQAEQGGRGKKSEATKSAETSGFSVRRVQQVRAVLAHSPPIAIAVLARMPRAAAR